MGNLTLRIKNKYSAVAVYDGDFYFRMTTPSVRSWDVAVPDPCLTLVKQGSGQAKLEPSKCRDRKVAVLYFFEQL